MYQVGKSMVLTIERESNYVMESDIINYNMER